jgi:alpha-L-rhamnosidase
MDRLGATLTPEAWDPAVKPNMSFSHAWGTAPINVINRQVIGLSVVKPGASHVLIRPQPGGLTWFRAKVPTIKGPISIVWDMRSSARHCTVELPGNMTAELDLPAVPSLRPTVAESPGPLPPPLERNGRLRWEPIRPGRRASCSPLRKYECDSGERYA